jgi:uncharacterized protein (AIM24 family)
MAEFSIREVENMRQVKLDIHDEVVRARKGAMSNMRGAITFYSDTGKALVCGRPTGTSTCTGS